MSTKIKNAKELNQAQFEYLVAAQQWKKLDQKVKYVSNQFQQATSTPITRLCAIKQFHM